MGNSFFSRVTACAVAFVLLVSAVSCVNNRYEISEENLDLNVTAFQEGVSLPLGSTVPIRLDSILSKTGLEEDIAKYLKAGADGAYSVSMTDTLDMSKDLASLTDMIELDAVRTEQTVDFRLEEVDMSSVTIPAIDFPYTKKLSEMVKLPEVKLPDFGSHEFRVSSGLSEFNVDLSPVNEALADNIENIQIKDTLAHIPEGFVLPPGVPVQDEYDLDTFRNLGVRVNEVFGLKEPMKMVIDAELPDNITNITDISFADGATMTIRATMEDCFFSAGELDPTFDLDLHDIFHLTEDSGDPLHPDEIHVDMEMSAKPGAMVEKSFGIKSLVFDPAEDIITENGKQRLYKEVFLEPVCALHYKEVKVSTALMEQHRDVIIRVDVEFDNFEVDDITFDAEVTGLEVEEEIEISSPSAMKLPSQVEKIGSVKFAENSGIMLSLEIENPIKGVNLDLESLELAFPEDIKVAADPGYDLEQNTVKMESLSLTGGFEKFIKIEELTLPEPVNGEITIKEQIEVKAVAGGNAVGVSLSDIPTTAAEDLKFKITATPVLKFDDCDLVIGKGGFDVNLTVGTINEKLPSEVAGMSVIPVYLEPVDGKQPLISVDVEMPDLKNILGQTSTLEIVPAGSGFALYFPDMIKFAESVQQNALYNYNLHALEYKQKFESVEFPIEKLEIKPVEGYAKGDVFVKGGVTVTGDNLTYKQLKTIVESDEAIVDVHVTMPDLVPSGVGAEMPTGRMTYGLDMLDDIELPDMIEQILGIELDNVKLTLDIDASELPRLNDGEKVNLEAKISLPSFVVLDKEDERVTNNLLTIDIPGRSVDGVDGIVFEMEPVSIVGMDLSEVDITSDDFKNQKVVLDGTVKFDNVDMSNWFGHNYTVGFAAEIKSDKEYAEGEKERIDIKTVKGRVNYSIDPIKQKIDLSEVSKTLNSDNMESVIDINRFYLALDVTTNLGVSAKADLKIVPYYDGQADETKALISENEIVLPGSPQADDTLTTSFWVSNTDQGMPAGYKFIDLDLVELIRDLPESIQLELVAGTDKEKECVFEPGSKYVLRAGYSAGVPLEFGEQFCVTYRDTIAGLPDEMAMLMEYGSLGLGGVIESSLPFNVDLAINLLDSEERMIPMRDGAGRLTISSCDAAGNPVKTPIQVIIGKEKDTVISDIEAVELVFTIDSRNAVGVPLREDSFIRVESLHALIPEGVTLDLKELDMFGEEEETEEDNR